jgi:hypothetical protein
MEVTLDDLKPVQLTPAPLVETGAIPDGVRNTLFNEYMSDPESSPDVLAVKHGLPITEVLMIFRNGNWVALKRETEKARREASDLQYETLITKDRPQIAREHLALGKNLEDLAAKHITWALESEEVLAPRDLKNMAEAALAATKIRATVVGLTEKVAADSIAKAQADNPQLKAALLVIGAKPIGRAPIYITADVKENA